MLSNLCSICLMLAQNEAEKRMTKIGLAFFAVFIFMLILDTVVKNKIVPKGKPMQYFLIFMFIATIVALVLLLIYYK